MKKNSYANSWFLIIMSMAIAVIFISMPSIYMLLHDAFSSYCVRPILRSTHYLKELRDAQRRKAAGVEEMFVLAGAYQHKYEELFGRYCELAAQSDYYADIAEIIEFKKRFAPSGHCAHIISVILNDSEHAIFVDKGHEHGIVENMVAVFNNCLVGKVTHVFPHMAKIMLITDRGCKCAAYAHTTNAKGIYEGTQQKDAARLVFVNHLEQLKKGDVIFTQGEGPDIPRGFALGTIQWWSQEDFQYQIQIKPIIDISELQYVLLIKKGDEQHISDFDSQKSMQNTRRE
jgi:rod shape-determining protein MreC